MIPLVAWLLWKLPLKREDIDVYAKVNDGRTPLDMARLAVSAHEHHWSDIRDLYSRHLADKRLLAKGALWTKTLRSPRRLMDWLLGLF
jgi:hypothetical protein